MPRLVVLAVLLAGCYGPKLSSPGFYCHAADVPACPNDQTCVDGRCVDKSEAARFDLAGVTDGPPPDQDGGGPTDLARADSKPADLSGKDSNGGPCGVKINELQVAGTTASDEFIELYNTCGTSIPLSGYQLVYRSAAGTTDVNFITFSSGSVPAGGFFLCAGSGYPAAAPRDVSYSGGSMAGAGGGIALVDGGGATVDSVGYGTATNAFVKGSPAPAPAASQSVGRLPDGHDSGNNASDFTVGAMPTPGAANQ